MSRNRIKKLIGKLVVLLCVVVMLCGCGAPTKDPIAEDYLVKMLDAIEKEDVDAACSLCTDKMLEENDLEAGIELLHDNWDGGEYTYKLIISNVTKSYTTDGNYKTINCNYEVVTKENSYVFEVTYIKDKVLAGFYMHKKYDPESK